MNPQIAEVAMIENQRQHARIVPISGLQASFEIQGLRVSNVVVASIGLGGMGGWLDESHFTYFEPLARLKNLQVTHPEFPVPVPDLRLVFSTLKGQSAQPGRMMFGAQFLNPPETFLNQLKSFLEGLPHG
jgi:hypothetical protein